MDWDYAQQQQQQQNFPLSFGHYLPGTSDDDSDQDDVSERDSMDLKQKQKDDFRRQQQNRAEQDKDDQQTLLVSKKKKWHLQESKSEKFRFTAFDKVSTGDPIVWHICKDKLNRSRLFEILFFQRDADNWKPRWETELQPLLPQVKDAREMYHLLHWINRDSLVFPCVLPLQRCHDLAIAFGITNNEVISQLRYLISKPYEVTSQFHSYFTIITREVGKFTTLELANEALEQYKQSLGKNSLLFHLEIKKRDDVNDLYDPYGLQLIRPFLD
jgi:hypothetical protein